MHVLLVTNPPSFVALFVKARCADCRYIVPVVAINFLALLALLLWWWLK